MCFGNHRKQFVLESWCVSEFTDNNLYYSVLVCFGIHRQFVLQRLGVFRNSQTTICITVSWCVSEFTDNNLYYSVLVCCGIHRQQFVLQRLGVLRNSQTTICITASWCVAEFTDNLYYSVLVCCGIHRQQFVLQRLGVFRNSQTTICITASWCVSEFTLTAMDVCLIVMITVIDLVSGFYPRLPPHWRTKTHSDITNAGSLQAISEYIFRHKMNGTSSSTALDDFYGTGMIIVFFFY